MTMNIHYFELWPESMSARVLIEEIRPELEKLQIQVNFVRVDMAAKEHRKPAFLALNPQGEPPVLEEDPGLGGHKNVVWDILGIHAYLSQRTPSSIFIPPICNMPLGLQWAGWSHTHLVEPVQALVAEWKLSNAPDPAQVTRLVKRLTRAVGILEGYIPPGGTTFLDRDFLHPNVKDPGTFGIADVMVGGALTYTHRIATATFDLAQFPNTAAYLAMLEQRPSFQTTFKGVTLGNPPPPVDMP